MKQESSDAGVIGESELDVGRRDTLKAVGAGTMALGTSLVGGLAAASSPAPASPRPAGNTTGPYNILFILTDQERYFRANELPRDYVLPAHH